MLIFVVCLTFVLLTSTTKIKDVACGEGGKDCSQGSPSSPCRTTDHICCHTKEKYKKQISDKGTCSSTPKKCQWHGGTCVSAKKNQCSTTVVPHLCNAQSCTCCIGDNICCKVNPKCRFRGGYCYKGTSKKLLCPSKKTLRKGCSGKRCNCCVPDRKCLCGEAPTFNRIIGGQPVRPKNKYPWMVGIQVPSYINGTYICGGAVINNHYILTAAHCLIDFFGVKRKPDDILVGVADHNQFSTQDDVEGATDLVGVKKIIIHKDYGQGPNNDIGLVRLQKPLDLMSHRELKPVCLPTKYNKTYEGEVGFIYGWGVKKYDHNNLQNVLQATSVPILKPSCNDKNIGDVRITPQMMCAGYKKGGKDSCLGDSGGPLTVEENGRHVLVGLTSFGDGCGLEESPGVYTRVTAFLDWIIEKTQDTSFCN